MDLYTHVIHIEWELFLSAEKPEAPYFAGGFDPSLLMGPQVQNQLIKDFKGTD